MTWQEHQLAEAIVREALGPGGEERLRAHRRRRIERHKRDLLAWAGVEEQLDAPERVQQVCRFLRRELGLAPRELETVGSAELDIACALQTLGSPGGDRERFHPLMDLFYFNAPYRYLPDDRPAIQEAPRPAAPEVGPDNELPEPIARRLEPLTAEIAKPDSEGRFPLLPMGEIAKLFDMGKLPRPPWRPPQF